MASMRTTLTLDTDVFNKIQKRVGEKKGSLKELVNNLLRQALSSPSQKISPVKLEIPVFHGKKGLQAGVSWDLSSSQMLEILDEKEF